MGVRLSEQVAWREIGGETFVIDLKSHTMYGLNPAGGQTWRGLEQGRTVSSIAEELAVGGGDDLSSVAMRAVESFLADLQELGLVTCERSLHKSPDVGSVEGMVPPQVVWQEELRSFGFSCAFQAGQSKACTQSPTQ